jgi:branched-chain amino acid transport system substrate-binding protein
MLKSLFAATSLAIVAALPQMAEAQNRIKIGLVTTLSGPNAALGREMVDGFNLGVRHADGRLGGIETEVLTGDDQFRPDAGRSVAERMVQRDRVDVVTGVVFSNILLALSDTVLRGNTLLINSNAGPSELAGRDCNQNFFVTSWQNDNVHESMGQHVQASNIRRVYIMAPNYPAGRDALAGFKRFFRGEVVGEVYTQLGQTDYAAELAALRAARPDATYVFYPGGMGVAFIRQYAQLGLMQQIPLFAPSFSADQTILPAVGDAAVGMFASTFWSEFLQNAPNQRFVRDFEAAHNRIPSPYAAQSYDTARLLDAAIRQVNGNVADRNALRTALRRADFESIRGPFRFNRNHFPIQNYYLTQIEKDDRNRLVARLRGTIFENHADAYISQCTMQW